MSSHIRSNLTFEQFAELANAPDMASEEKIGFPVEYRRGRSDAILVDVRAKLTNLDQDGATILDIGCGCGELAEAVVEHGTQAGRSLCLSDSKEMLDALKCSVAGVTQVPGPFPQTIAEIQKAYEDGFDAILVYSVLQYPFANSNASEFVDGAAMLLKPGGQLLFADLPNSSMRNRFLASENGIAHHKATYGPEGLPDTRFNQLVPGQMDDGFILGLATRMRMAGFHAYLMPQNRALPMSNRREDLLIVKP